MISTASYLMPVRKYWGVANSIMSPQIDLCENSYQLLSRDLLSRRQRIQPMFSQEPPLEPTLIMRKLELPLPVLAS